jgi:AcrR family transcriptional regulator
VAREWIPISTSPKGRLALAAAREFGSRPYAEVTVSALAEAAHVTTGALYHHFESKLGLYLFVRSDVERRLTDRMAGAATAVPTASTGERLGAAMAVGFDFAVQARFAWLLSEPPIGEGSDDDVATQLVALFPSLPAPLGAILAAAWRAAVGSVARGTDPDDVRAALMRIRVD